MKVVLRNRLKTIKSYQIQEQLRNPVRFGPNPYPTSQDVGPTRKNLTAVEDRSNRQPARGLQIPASC